VTWGGPNVDLAAAKALGIHDELIPRKAGSREAEKSERLEDGKCDLSDKEWSAIEPLCSTFRQNHIGKRSHRETVGNAIYLVNRQMGFSLLPEDRDNPEAFRQRAYSFARSGKWRAIYNAAQKSGTWSRSRLAALKAVADWADRVVERIAVKRAKARAATAHQAGAIS
jgi:hypothetical protein